MLVNLPRARSLMARDGLDAIIGARPENLVYLTDSEAHVFFGHAVERDPERDYYAVLPLREDVRPTYVCTANVCMYLVDQPTWMDVRVYGTYEPDVWSGSPLSDDDRRFQAVVAETQARRLPSPHGRAAAAALQEMGLAAARIGVDDMRVAARLSAEPGLHCTFVDAFELLREIRAVKTPEEVRRLRRAAENNDAARDEVFRRVRDGVTWRELKLAYDTRMLELGSVPRFWAAGCGPWPYRHTVWQDGAPALERRVRPGDVIRLDLGGTYQWYWADTAKQGVFARPAPGSYGRAMEALLAAREACEPLLRPGTPVREVVRAAEACVRRYELPGFRRLFGHGIGLDWYEWPRVGRDSGDVIEEGMVFNLEGGPSAIPWGGVNLEATYHVAGDGFERWTANNDFIWEP